MASYAMEALKSLKTLVARVVSETNPQLVYSIEKHGVGEWSCSCPRHRFAKPGKNGKKFPCKHLMRAWSIGKAFKKAGVENGVKTDDKGAVEILRAEAF